MKRNKPPHKPKSPKKAHAVGERREVPDFKRLAKTALALHRHLVEKAEEKDREQNQPRIK